MIKVGITGNIGSGKTWVCKIFEALGTPIFYADLEARKILHSPASIREIRHLFGDEVIKNQVEIDRKKLAAIVFSNAQELHKLNQLIHPKLREHFLKWAEDQNHAPYVIQEAAILFENGFDSTVDQTITIAAPKDIRLKRVMERDHATREEVLARMKHQWPDKKKEQAADHLIINDGHHMVLPQVLNIHQKFIQ
jgi:dephospho-CoA kinase